MEEMTMPTEATPSASDVQKVVVNCYKCGAELKVKIGG